MYEWRTGRSCVYKNNIHLVFVTKYRYKVLKGDVGLKVRELIRQTCEAFEIEIIKGSSVRIMFTYYYPRRQTWRPVR